MSLSTLSESLPVALVSGDGEVTVAVSLSTCRTCNNKRFPFVLVAQ